MTQHSTEPYRDSIARVIVPRESANDDTVVLIRWLVDEGSVVLEGAPVAEIETSKTNIIVESPSAGTIVLLQEPGTEVSVGSTIAEIRQFGDRYENPALSASLAETTATAPPDSSSGALPVEVGPMFSQAARKEMQLHGVDESAFRGWDFVRAEDVRRKVGLCVDAQLPISSPAPPETENISSESLHRASGRSRRLSHAKRTEIRALSLVRSTVVPSSLHRLVDTRGARRAAQRVAKVLKGIILPIVIYEASRLLRRYPLLNAVSEGTDVFVYQEINIGIAVDAGKGLKVVTVPTPLEGGILGIEQSILDIWDRYEGNTLNQDELRSATFTISDMSALDVDIVVPVVNLGTSAILGIGSPQSDGSQWFSLVFDHRVTEGREASRFLGDLKERIESYGRAFSTGGSEGIVDALRCDKCGRTVREDIDLGGLGIFRSEGLDGTLKKICSLCIRGF